MPPAVISSEINSVAMILFLLDLPDGFTNLIISKIGSPIIRIFLLILFFTTKLNFSKKLILLSFFTTVFKSSFK